MGFSSSIGLWEFRRVSSRHPFHLLTINTHRRRVYYLWEKLTPTVRIMNSKQAYLEKENEIKIILWIILWLNFKLAKYNNLKILTNFYVTQASNFAFGRFPILCSFFIYLEWTEKEKVYSSFIHDIARRRWRWSYSRFIGS